MRLSITGGYIHDPRDTSSHKMSVLSEAHEASVLALEMRIHLMCILQGMSVQEPEEVYLITVCGRDNAGALGLYRQCLEGTAWITGGGTPLDRDRLTIVPTSKVLAVDRLRRKQEESKPWVRDQTKC